MSTTPYLTVITPMYNERENVPHTVEQVTAALDGQFGSWELIMVDDGSTDGTAQVAAEAAARDPRVRLVSYSPNRGRGAALRAGFEAARGELVATTESDLTYGADIVAQMVRQLESNGALDMVVASPYMPGGVVEGVPFLRLAVSRLGNLLLRWALPGSVHTISGMTRAYRRRLLDGLELESDGKEIHLEILAKALALGARVTEIPATLTWRKRGASKFRFRATALSHLAFCVFERPILLFGVLGLLSLLAGICIGAYLVFVWLTTGYWNADRPLVAMTLVLMIAGTQGLAFGVIGSQINLLRRELFRVQRQNRRLEQQLAAAMKAEDEESQT